MREPTGGLRERAGASVGASRTAGFERATLLRSLAISLAAALLMTIAGAFGSGALPPPMRLLYWLAGFGLGSVVGHLVAHWIMRIRWFDGRPWATSAAIGGLMSIPYVFVIWAITAWFYGGRAAVLSLPQLVVPVLAISLAMTVLHALAARRPLETHAAAAGSAPPRFLQRLPGKLKGAALYAVEAEDHYLRLHTERGSDLILMRLADAVAELDGLEGAQTHRSWWVAKDGVESARRDNGRAILRLKSGVEAPVSRTYVKALRDEGWF